MNRGMWHQELAVTLRQLRPLFYIVGILDTILRSAVLPDGFFTQLYHLRWPGLGLMIGMDRFLWTMLGVAVAADLADHLARTQPAAWLAASVQLAAGFAVRGGALIVASGAVVRLTLALVIGTVCAFIVRYLRSPRVVMALGTVLSLVALAGSSVLATLHTAWRIVPGSGPALPLLASVASWFGLPDYVQQPADLNASANLRYALAHPGFKSLPHLFTLSTIYTPAAAMGGAGMILALLLAVSLQKHRCTWQAALPTLFNLPVTFIWTLPALLNWWLLIPMIVAPLLVQLFYVGGLLLRIIPPAIYVVPSTTPPLLSAWLQTNGDWRALLMAILALALATAIYWPFVRRMLSEGGESHAAVL